MPKIPVQPFSEQKSGQRGLNVQRFHEALQQFSGGDSAGLLQYYFESHREGRKLFEQLQLPHVGSQLEQVLDAVKQQHEMASRREKSFWLSLVSSIFSKKDLRARGFKFSKTQFTNSRRKDAKIKTKKASKSEEAKQIVREFFDKTTTPAPNRVVKKKRSSPDEPEEMVPVKYLKCCVSCAYSEFKKVHPEIVISETTFRKTVPEYVKRPRKTTDMCVSCDQTKKTDSSHLSELQDHIQEELHSQIPDQIQEMQREIQSHIQQEIQSQMQQEIQSQMQQEIQSRMQQAMQTQMQVADLEPTENIHPSLE